MAEEIVVDAKKDMLDQSIGSVVRHAITAAGAILVFKGITTPEVLAGLASNVAAIVVGLAMYVTSQVWSLVQKHLQIAKTEEIVAAVKAEE